jgi:hypothetical protein
MIEITDEFKRKVVEALAVDRKTYDGPNGRFANRWKINESVYSRLKTGEIDGLLKDATWLEIGRKLGVKLNNKQWNLARTEVFITIEQDVEFCQQNAKGLIYVDDCGIGKTVATNYLSRTRKNCFRIDASQSKSTLDFIKAIASEIGVSTDGKRGEIKAKIKYCLNNLPNPVVIIDEAGDINPAVVMEIKELWNATEGACGWYLIGAEAFRVFIERGIKNDKPGFRELFSRFGERYSKTVPNSRAEKVGFYKQLITEVLVNNMESNSALLKTIVNKCITEDSSGNIGGLRRAETLLILNS